MMRNLEIAILHKTPGWEMAVQQLGLCAEFSEQVSDAHLSKRAMVIVNRLPDRREKRCLEQYVRNSGLLLVCSEAAPAFPVLQHRRFRRKSHVVNLAMAGHQSSLLLDMLPPFDMPSSSLPGGIWAEGQGFIGYWGIDLDRQLLNTQNARKYFYHPHGKHPNEVVSRISKANIIRLLHYNIKQLFLAAGLPFVHLSYQPDACAGNFLYRIDSDDGSRDQVDKYYRIANDNGIRISWFLHVEAHQSWLSDFRKFERQEIAVHCYRHYNYPKLEDNFQNVQIARDLLQQANLATAGYAAPYGTWHDKLQQMIERQHFEYSSEFALDYDNLPFFPHWHKGLAQTLQIPIHPVCIGSFRRTTASDQEIIDYFRFASNRLRSWHQPVIFYDHLLHDKHHIVRRIFENAIDDGLKPITFAEYGRWWRKRISRKPQVFVSRNGDLIHSSKHETALLAHWADGSTMVIPGAGAFQTAELDSYKRQAPEINEDLGGLRGMHWRLLHYSILDRLWRRKPADVNDLTMEEKVLDKPAN